MEEFADSSTQQTAQATDESAVKEATCTADADGRPTFPKLMPNDYYVEYMRKMKKALKPYVRGIIVLIFLFIGLAMACMITGINASAPLGREDYTATIACGTLAAIDLAILAFVVWVRPRFDLSVRDCRMRILVNNRYADYIDMGFSTKEAYQLTLQWIDSQEAQAAMRNAEASMAGMLIMSNMMRRK